MGTGRWSQSLKTENFSPSGGRGEGIFFLAQKLSKIHFTQFLCNFILLPFLLFHFPLATSFFFFIFLFSGKFNLIWKEPFYSLFHARVVFYRSLSEFPLFKEILSVIGGKWNTLEGQPWAFVPSPFPWRGSSPLLPAWLYPSPQQLNNTGYYVLYVFLSVSPFLPSFLLSVSVSSVLDAGSVLSLRVALPLPTATK